MNIRQRIHALPSLQLGIGYTRIELDISWLLVGPIAMWVIATIYVSVMQADLPRLQTWVVAALILGFIFLSLLVHLLAHLAVARALGCEIPDRIPVYLIADSAQVWMAASGAGREVISAIAGPLGQGLLAALAYALWNLQLGPFIDTITSFLAFFNLGVMALNLTPAFPFDGGRLVRAAVWRLLGLPGLATRLALNLGFAITGALIVWGIVLIVQQDRFSLGTGIATFILAALVLISLARGRGWRWDRLERITRLSLRAIVIRVFLVVLLLLPLAALTFGLIPVNNGLEAPGFAVSVEPMVQLPEEYRYPSTGSFVLTTVISHAPILAGEWVYTYLDTSVRLKSQDQIVPPDKTIQSVADENYQELLRSETVAVIIGLRLAGYPVDIEYDGASIVSVLSRSPAAKVLQIGDIITGINGKSVMSPSDLTSHLEVQKQGVVLELQIERDGKTLEVNVLAMEPVQPGGSVRIGISVVQHNTGLNLPFPVEIIPQKVRGGPSAGLMFALGVYNLVTSQDLTGGRKIAGTGTIDLNGEVGTIGGIRQKVVTAERSGAVYFLSPPGNYSDALTIAKHITVIQVATAQEAINFLQGLSPLGND